MGLFIERYVRSPLAQLLSDTPSELPELRLTLNSESVQIDVGDEKLTVKRVEGMAGTRSDLASDISDVLPGTDI